MTIADFTIHNQRFLRFLSGYLVVPGAGIDDADDDKEDEPGGAAGCVVHVVAGA